MDFGYDPSDELVESDTSSLFNPHDKDDIKLSRRRRLTNLAQKLTKENVQEIRRDEKNRDEEGRSTALAAGPSEAIVSSGRATAGGSFAGGLQDKLFAKMVQQILPA